MVSKTEPGVPVAEQLRAMSPQMLSCRELGHNWARGKAMHVTSSRGKKVLEAERVLTCDGDCGCTRTDSFARDEYGQLVKYRSQIKYPPGYALEREVPEEPVGRVTRNTARVALMQLLAPGYSW